MNEFSKRAISAFPPSLSAFAVIFLLSFVSLNTSYGYIIAVSFGATMVILFVYPTSSFAQPKNIFFGHVITAMSGIFFLEISLPLTLAIAAAVSVGIFLMIISNLVHPPAGGNPIAILLGGHNLDFLFPTILFGTILIILLGVIINWYVLKIKYPY